MPKIIKLSARAALSYGQLLPLGENNSESKPLLTCGYTQIWKGFGSQPQGKIRCRRLLGILQYIVVLPGRTSDAADPNLYLHWPLIWRHQLRGDVGTLCGRHRSTFIATVQVYSIVASRQREAIDMALQTTNIVLLLLLVVRKMHSHPNISV